MERDASLLGPLLAVGIPGTEPTAELITRLRRLHAKSLVLFERNIVSPEQVARLIRRLEEGVGWRLLVMIDHEGGRVVRFRAGVTRFPDALAMGRRGDPQAVARQGTVEAQELGRMGIRANLAPCVDVLSEGCDPVIGDRSYGSDPALVSSLAVARITALQANGLRITAIEDHTEIPHDGCRPKKRRRV